MNQRAAAEPVGERDATYAAAVRAVVGVAIVLLEYALVAVHFDGTTLLGRGGWVAGLSASGEVFTAASVILTAGLLLNWAVLSAALQSLAATLERPSARWGAVHLVACGVAWGAAATLFAGPRGWGVELGSFLVALVGGVAALGALLRALFGRAAWSLASALGRVAVAGLGLGLVAWFVGMQSRPLWPVLAQSTLTFSAAILRALGGDVRIDPAAATLGMGEFTVEVAAPCSGIEGMGLVGVFLAGYVYRFRATLHWQRAVVLLPPAIALAWLANAARIAALVAIGALGSEDVAFGGFHSKAGWVMFCAITLGFVVLLERSRFFARAPVEPVASANVVVDNPTAGYCLPFLALIATSLLTGSFASDTDYLYPLRLVAALAALYWLREYHRSLRPTISLGAVLWGAAVFVVWLAFTPVDLEVARLARERLWELGTLERGGWLACRVVGTSVVVPIVEELAFRGFLQRRLVSRDFSEAPFGKTTAWAIAGSALAFGLLHPSWILGTLAGVAYSLAMLHRGRLEDAMVAHGVTNLLLSLWALAFGRWDLWG